MQDFGLSDLAWAFGSLFCVSIIGILWTQRSAIVSTLSGQWRASLERARLQKAARERLYGYADMSSQDKTMPVPGMVSGAIPRPGTAAAAIDLVFLAGNLTEAQYIELGARLQDRRGKFVFSGKTLYKIAGGNHDEFLVSMRRWRGEEQAEVAHVTPIVGRPTNARFDTDADYPYRAPA